MELTDKCKVDFEKWYNSNLLTIQGRNIYCIEIHYIPKNMLYGVYVDFFDENDIQISVRKSVVHGYYFVVTDDNENHLPQKTRNESRTEAIKKANEIYNGINQ